jgi:hypothetical protein
VYSCVGFAKNTPESILPSPYFQKYELTVPVVVLVKFTFCPAQICVGAAVKAIVGAVPVLIISGLVRTQPVEVTTVQVAVNAPTAV